MSSSLWCLWSQTEQAPELLWENKRMSNTNGHIVSKITCACEVRASTEAEYNYTAIPVGGCGTNQNTAEAPQPRGFRRLGMSVYSICCLTKMQAQPRMEAMHFVTRLWPHHGPTAFDNTGLPHANILPKLILRVGVYAECSCKCQCAQTWVQLYQTC